MTIQYKRIDGFLGYMVGSDGSVWSSYTRKNVNTKSGQRLRRSNIWRKLRTSTTRKGYKMVCLCIDGKKYYRQVHRLILTAFRGECPARLVARHLDGNPANNSITNLTWDTQVVNISDKKLHGTVSEGVRNGKAKLTEKEVEDIKQKYNRKYASQEQLARQYGIGQAQVSRIIRGVSWIHLKR